MINLAEFHFIRPYCLLALIPVIGTVILLLKNKLDQGNWSQVCDTALLPFVLQQKPNNKKRWRLSISAFSSVLAVLALAGPTWEQLPIPVFRNDAALVIALDLSRSMDATDIKPSRLSLARFKIADILKQRKVGQTALLVYAGDVFTVTPLTEDSETIASQISVLNTEIMPTQGSNTLLAIKKASNLLKQTGLQSGDILLITDGVDMANSNEIITALAGYHLSILGVGTSKGAPIKAQAGFVKDNQGNIIIPKLNNSSLFKLANKGNGLYKTISSDDSDIEAILNQLDKTIGQASQKDNHLLIDQWHEKGPWLLLLILPLVALSFRKGFILILIFLLPYPKMANALEWNDWWQTQDQQAQQAFKQDNFEQAAEQFNHRQWKAAAQYKNNQFEQAVESLQDTQTADGLYNKGNALAHLGKLQEAIDAYKKSLQINPNNEDAKYNQEQIEKLLEKQQQQTQQSGDDGENSEQQNSEQSSTEQNEGQQNSAQNSTETNEEQQNNATETSDEPHEDDEKTDAKQLTDKENPDDETPEQTQNSQKPESDSETSEYNELRQAHEQWLKRIPDDHGGLLKRKFKYQYRQRRRNK